MKLRCYQVEGAKSTYDKIHDKDITGFLCISPTGTGKTVIINSVLKKLCLNYPDKRFIVVTHNKDIIKQNEASMKRYWKNADTGVYSAGLNRREWKNQIIYCGIQSVYKRPEILGKVSVAFVDEAHLLPPNDMTMYRKFFNHLLKVNPKMKMPLFSATPFRMGSGHLIDTDWADDTAFDFTETENFMWFVNQGYLSPLVTKKASKEIDITDCPIRGGEFSDRDLQKLSNTEVNNRAVVDECIKYGFDRKHWMVFVTGVDHGHNLADTFLSFGISAICLHADSDNRDEHLKLWEEGTYKVMVNVGLYTTGYDFPELDLIAVARATQSTSLWVQMLGRGTRPVYSDASSYDLTTSSGRLDAMSQSSKQNCLILDFAGNTRRLGPINAPIIPKERRKGQANDGEGMQKACPECQSYVHISVRTCPDCGFKFPKPDVEVDKHADDTDVMVAKSPEPKLIEVPVLSVGYSKGSSKASGNMYFRVTYHTLNGTFNEYFYPDHKHHLPKSIFKRWWWTRLTSVEKSLHRSKDLYKYPSSVEDAVDRASSIIRIPSSITVDLNTKYRDVTGHSFN